MESLSQLFRIGNGPSSSHSIGPETASQLFGAQYRSADSYKVILYGSLAKTGKGHVTDLVIAKALGDRCEIIFDKNQPDIPHPNTMDFYAYKGGKEIGYWRVLSIGGGEIKITNFEVKEPAQVYTENSFDEIKAKCKRENWRLSDYVFNVEGQGITEYLNTVWTTMKECVHRGLHETGTLPGILKVERRANVLFEGNHYGEREDIRENRMVCAYAFAASEENASGSIVVTAPTCGSCGVLPAVLIYHQNQYNFKDEHIIRALAAAGIVGNIVKTNASISGAECGCQAEIGTACSMAAAALGELFDMSIDQIEYAAEVAMEHHLGLTCDPIAGLVQIPCIERNAVAAMRAINAVSLANFLTKSRKISFDTVVHTMYETGCDLFSKYRETGEGGLAKFHKID